MAVSKRGWIAVVMALALLVSGACKPKADGDRVSDALPVSGKGRYVEAVWTPPDADLSIYNGFCVDPEGRVEVYVNDGVYRSADGTAWEAISALWYFDARESAPSEDGASRTPIDLRYVAFDAQDRRTIAYEHFDSRIETTIARINDDGSLDEIPIDWHVLNYESEDALPANPEPPSDQFMGDAGSAIEAAALPSATGEGPETTDESLPDAMSAWDEHLPQISGLAIAKNGDLLVGDRGCGVVRYDGQGRFLAAYPGGNGFTVWDNTLLMLTRGDVLTGESDAMIVDLETDQKTVFPFPDAARSDAGNAFFASRGGRAYMACPAGVFRLREDDSGWDMLVDGMICSLSSPASLLLGFAALPDEAFFFAQNARSTPAFSCFRYDPDIPPPSETLRVFGLIDNPSTRLAASALMRRYPEMRVTVSAAFPQDSDVSESTYREAVERMRNELNSGEGPDVFLLDGLPPEAFVGAQALLDLKPLSQSYIDSGAWLPNVARAFEKDGRCLALPARFSYSTLAGRREALGMVKTLDDLAAYAESHPGMRVLYDLRPESLFYRFLPTSLPAMVAADGSLDRKAFVAYLEAIRRLAATAPDGLPPSSMLQTLPDADELTETPDAAQGILDSEGFAAYLSGMASFASGSASGVWDLELANALQRAVEDGTVVALPSIDGRARFTPLEIYAINAKSAQLERAKEFVWLALSAELQSADFASGLPIALDALAQGEDLEADTDRSDVFYLSETQFLPIQALDENDLDAIRSFVASLDTPAFYSQRLCEAIAQDGAPYFEGTIDIDKLASRVNERLDMLAIP